MIPHAFILLPLALTYLARTNVDTMCCPGDEAVDAASATRSTSNDADCSVLDPSSTYAFIVGLDLDGEWLEEEPFYGDAQMIKSLKTVCGIPDHRIVHLPDHEATKDRVMREFHNVLLRMGENDTLFLYYGGHGEDDNFQLSGENNWLHEEVIDEIETNFKGKKVVMLVDACYAGCFGVRLHRRWERGDLRVSWCCLMETLPDATAAGEYSFTEEWLRTIEDGASEGNLTLADLISRVADEVARKKKEIVTVFACGSGVVLDAPFPFSHSKKPEISAATIDTSPDPPPMPPREVHKESDWERPASISVGDEIIAKHKKWHSQTSPTSPTMCPCWFYGTVVGCSDESNQVEVELRDAITNNKWKTTVSRKQLLSSLHCYEEVMPRENADVLLKIAETSHAYVSYGDFTAGTHVNILYEEDDGSQAIYDAEILIPRCATWKDYAKKTYKPGPLIPVWWTEEESESLVHLWRCRVIGKGGPKEEWEKFCKRKEIEAANDIKTPRDALLQAFSAADKYLAKFSVALSQASNGKYKAGMDCKCFDAESGSWIRADLVDLSMDKIPSRVIAGHLCYRESGPYALVYWHDDASLELVPLRFVRARDA